MERTDADDLKLVHEPVGVDAPDEAAERAAVRAVHVPDQRAAPAIEAGPAIKSEASVESEPGFDDELAVGVTPADEAGSGQTDTLTDTLTERERQVLAFERRWWKHAGSKEQAIRDQFGMSSTRYYQVLNGLLDNATALAHDPVLVKRLRRLRAARTRARSGGRVA
jgi:hypothetical protein